MRTSLICTSALALGLLFASSSAYAARHGAAPARTSRSTRSSASSRGSAHASAPKNKTITVGYQNKLIREVAGVTAGQPAGASGNWSITRTAPKSGKTRGFTADWTWGPGNHVMVMVPSVIGTINVAKGKAPKGAARVSASPMSYTAGLQ